MKRLLIVETIPDRHGTFEGEALKQSLEIMKKGWDGRTTRHLKIDIEQGFTKKRFFELLKEDADYLHISAHGKPDRRDKKTKHVLAIGNKKKVTSQEIKKHKPKAAHIFVSACSAGYIDLARAFFDFDEEKKGTYIAPLKPIPFDEAFLTALQFHRGAFLERSNRKAARYVEELKSVKKTYRLYIFPRDLRT